MECRWRGYRVSFEISFNGRVLSLKHHLLRQMAVEKDTDGSVQTDLFLHRHRERWKPDVNEKSAYERERESLFCFAFVLFLSQYVSSSCLFLCSFLFVFETWNPTLPYPPFRWHFACGFWCEISQYPVEKSGFQACGRGLYAICVLSFVFEDLGVSRTRICEIYSSNVTFLADVVRILGIRMNIEVLRFKIWRVFRF